MKNKLLSIAFILNLLAFVYFIVPFLIIVLFKVEQVDITYWCYISKIGRTVLLVILAGIIYLWIDNIKYITKNNKGTKHLLLLIFLNWIYSPIFYIRHRRNKD